MSLRPLEAGVMFWAGRDPLETVREVKSLGARSGQLGVPGDLDLTGAAAGWRAAIEGEDFALVTVFAAYVGEDYADIPTVERTVGFIPPGYRAEREARTLAVIDFAAAVGVKSFACHIGCVPEDRADENYVGVRDMVRRICDHAASHGMSFALETGQEPAKVLLEFFEDVGRTNLAVNFDPANMILYGSGDPIEALGILGPHVVSVHAKDGDWPNPAVAGSLGVERPLGAGAVGMQRFTAKLREIGYAGTLNVEREGTSPEQWRSDVAAAVALLNSLTQ